MRYQVSFTLPSRKDLSCAIRKNFTKDTRALTLAYECLAVAVQNASGLFKFGAGLLLCFSQWYEQITSKEENYLSQEAELIPLGKNILPMFKTIATFFTAEMLSIFLGSDYLVMEWMYGLIRGVLASESMGYLYGDVLSRRLYPNLRQEALLQAPFFNIRSKKSSSELTDISPVQSGSRFLNYPGEPIWEPFAKTIALLGHGAFNQASKYSKEELEKLLCCNPREIEKNYTGNDPKITWIGHACWLIQFNGINILTDPHFGDVGILFKRYTRPGILLDKLPPIHFVLLSHNHEDHANTQVLPTLSLHQPHVFAGAGSQAWLESFDFNKSAEFNWWDSVTVEKGSTKMTITAIPAQHGSITHPGNINKMLWCGWVIQTNGKTICFLGDTADGSKLVDRNHQHQDLFDQIKSKFPKIDIVFIPIAPDGEEEVHLNHQQAIEVCKKLDARIFIPMHWGAHRQEDQRVERPIEVFMQAAQYQKIENILPVKIGASFTVEEACTKKIPSECLLSSALWDEKFSNLTA